MDRRTSIDLAAAFVVTGAPSLGWRVRAFRRSRTSLSAYVTLERDGVEVVVRLSDHRSNLSTWDRARGAGFFQVLHRNLSKLAHLPAYLAARYSMLSVSRSRGEPLPP